jgi:hypothetical protein
MNENKISSRHDWVFGTPLKDIVKDKSALIESYVSDMLNRTQEMFKWSNLPDTIPQKELELILQTKGNVTIAEVDGKLYALWGNLGGKLNEYYFPCDSIVTNPYLNLSKTYNINNDCVLIRNDMMMCGNLPRDYRYATLIAECDISLKFGCITKRIMKLISADNDTTKTDAEQFLKDVEEGTKLGVIGHNAFFEGVKTHDFSDANASNTKDLVELRQYLVSSWFIDYGLNANFNMKREAINEAEGSMNEDSLAPLVDNMLRERKEGVERVNKMFGTNISVELNSSWKVVHKEYFAPTEKPKEEPKEDKSNDETERND